MPWGLACQGVSVCGWLTGRHISKDVLGCSHRCEDVRSHFLLGDRGFLSMFSTSSFASTWDTEKLKRVSLLLTGTSLTNNTIVILLETFTGLRLCVIKWPEIQEKTGPSKERWQGTLAQLHTAWVGEMPGPCGLIRRILLKLETVAKAMCGPG